MLTILLYHNCIILVGILSCNKSDSPIKLLLQVVSSWLYKPVLRKLKKKSPGAYPPELRAFAMTLKFYSTKAYNYVRDSFDLGLPHVSIIWRWCDSVNVEPGFTKDVLMAMKAKVLAA